MPIDLSHATPDQASELAFQLKTHAVSWGSKDLSAILAFLARHQATVPTWQFYAAGQAWAIHPEGLRLIEATLDVFGGTVHGNEMCEGALDQAVRSKKLAMFERLADPALVWNEDQQAMVLRVLDQATASNPLWREAFWNRVPLDNRPALYGRQIREFGLSCVGAMEDLVAFHAQVLHPRPADLVQGVVEVFYHTLIDLEPDAETVMLAPPAEAWERVRTQVNADDVLAALVDRVGSGATLVKCSYYLSACDAILADVSPAVRAPWLAREDVDLPRARAAGRHADLQGQPAPAPSRARRRT